MRMGDAGTISRLLSASKNDCVVDSKFSDPKGRSPSAMFFATRKNNSFGGSMTLPFSFFRYLGSSMFITLPVMGGSLYDSRLFLSIRNLIPSGHQPEKIRQSVDIFEYFLILKPVLKE